jgi:hypothetical protein
MHFSFLYKFCSFTFQQYSVDCYISAGVTKNSVEVSSTNMADMSNEGRSTVEEAVLLLLFSTS